MARTPMWRRYLRFWGTDVRADVEAELGFRVDALAERLVRKGRAPAESKGGGRAPLRRLRAGEGGVRRHRQGMGAAAALAAAPGRSPRGPADRRSLAREEPGVHHRRRGRPGSGSRRRDGDDQRDQRGVRRPLPSPSRTAS